MFRQNKGTRLFYLIFLLIIVVSIVLRVPRLDLRPMHTDEAVQAVKFGALLEENYYRYDPSEFHGPTLYYFTLIPALLTSEGAFAEIDEFTIRIVPAAFGVLLIVLLLMLSGGLNRMTIIAAGLLTAISPAMVFYSRYYIQEMALVFFSFAVMVSGYRYLKNRNTGWAAAVGFFLGLLHATKETSIIIIGSIVTALFVTVWLETKFYSPGKKLLQKFNNFHIIVLAVTAIVVSALFYSSFFSNPRGILDSYLTFGSYLGKASNNNVHVHPWYFYLKTLIYSRTSSGMIWSEVIIVLLAGSGIVAALRNKKTPGIDIRLLRFISLYTLILVLVYSVIPYKTPWLALGFLHGMIVLAGVGFSFILSNYPDKYFRIILVFFVCAGGVHLTVQSYLSNNEYYADPSNPYVYAHTTDDIVRIAERVEELSKVHPDGNNMYIEVVAPGSDYWPLPWYLRSFPNTGWWNEVDPNAPAGTVIIASATVEQDIVKKLYEIPPPGERVLYVPLFNTYTELRPGIEIRSYVTRELWENFVQSKDAESKIVR